MSPHLHPPLLFQLKVEESQVESDRELDKSFEKDKTRKRVNNPLSFEGNRSYFHSLHFIINIQLPIYPCPVYLLTQHIL